MVKLSDILDDFGAGGANLWAGGGLTNLRDVLRGLLSRIASAAEDTSELEASLEADRVDGQLVVKLDDHTLWVWDVDSTLVAGSEVIFPDDVELGPGRFLRVTPPATGLSPNVQAGTATLVAGLAAVATATVTAQSVIIVTRKTPAGTMGVEWDTATRTPGDPGSFTIKSLKTDKTVETVDTSSLDYIVVG